MCRESLWFGRNNHYTTIASSFSLNSVPNVLALKTFVANVFPLFSTAESHGQWVLSSAVSNSYLLFAVSALGAASRLAIAQEQRSPSSAEPFDLRRTDYHSTSAHAIWLKLQAIQLLNSAIAQDLVSDLESVIYSIMCLLMISVRTFLSADPLDACFGHGKGRKLTIGGEDHEQR